MTKDEMKNRISLALKDPILQQGFEIICKENTELKEQLESERDLPEEYEKRINEIPLVIDPCKQCKVYKKHNGYDIGDRLVEGVWQKGFCDDCCWCYGSKFEMK